MDNLSYINNTDIGQVEELFKKYKDNPSSVDHGWQKFFEGFELGQTDYNGVEQPTLLPSEFKVINLIMAYRQRGHLFTKTESCPYPTPVHPYP